MIDKRLGQLNVTIRRADRSKDFWELTHAFVIPEGRWDLTGGGAMAEWMVDLKYRYPSDVFGADHHLLGLAIVDERIAWEAGFIQSWGDGDHEQVLIHTEAHNNYWANAIMGSDAGYDWRQRSGPYRWAKWGANVDRLEGAGLPWPPAPWESSEVHASGGVHMSIACIWTFKEAFPWWKLWWTKIVDFFKGLFGANG